MERNTSRRKRADFTPGVKDSLASAANHHCVRPGCNRLTHVFDITTRKYVHFGAAAHDAAASEGGPRPDHTMTRAQLRAYDNGAWLCMGCATLVDVLSPRFPPGMLKKWQYDAHQHLVNVALHPMPDANIPWRTSVSNTRSFCARLRKVAPQMDYRRVVAFTDSVMSLLEQLVRDCNGLQAGDHPLSSLYAHTVNVQLRVTDALREIVKYIRAGGDGWHRAWPDGWNAAPAPSVTSGDDQVSAWWSDVLEARYDLTEFYMGRYDHRRLDLW